MDSESPKKASGSQPNGDVLFVYSKSGDGNGYQVLRQRDDEIQGGTMRPLDEGKPIHGEVISLHAREESPLLFDVEVHHRTATRRSTGGPPQVATEKYRSGWDSIWSTKSGSHSLN